MCKVDVSSSWTPSLSSNWPSAPAFQSHQLLVPSLDSIGRENSLLLSTSFFYYYFLMGFVLFLKRAEQSCCWFNWLSHNKSLE